MSGALSRRGFARLLGVGMTWAAAPTSPAPASLDAAASAAPGLIRLSANESPYGPSPAVLEAIRQAIPRACRYPDGEVERLAADLGRHHELDAEHVLLGSGSSEVLRLAVAAAAGASPAPVVVANPTFEAVAMHARHTGVAVTSVPLTADHRHDMTAMLEAAAGAGLIYVCNPNNPTASVTPAADLRAFLAAVPPQTVVLVDEAYHHFAAGGGYESMLPLVPRLPNLVVTRTFSKIHGIAGLRCGYGVAQPALVARLRAQQAWDSPNLMGLVAASAALADAAHVESSRQRNLAVRSECCAALAARGLRVIPSQANFFMVDLGAEARPTIAALRARGVEVGRFFPSLPTHLRVTVGTRSEMEAFLTALAAILPAAA